MGNFISTIIILAGTCSGAVPQHSGRLFTVNGEVEPEYGKFYHTNKGQIKSAYGRAARGHRLSPRPVMLRQIRAPSTGQPIHLMPANCPGTCAIMVPLLQHVVQTRSYWQGMRKPQKQNVVSSVNLYHPTIQLRLKCLLCVLDGRHDASTDPVLIPHSRAVVPCGVLSSP